MSVPAADTPRLYQQVAATIERAIAEGQYQPGQRLASGRTSGVAPAPPRDSTLEPSTRPRRDDCLRAKWLRWRPR
jgi:hypothetical protein